MTKRIIDAMVAFFNVYPIGATFTGHLADTAKKFGLSATTLRKYADVEYTTEIHTTEVTEKEYNDAYNLWDDLEYVHECGFEEDTGYREENGRYYYDEVKEFYRVNGKKF